MPSASVEQCFYCDCLLNARTRNQQGDHFPVPERHGGAFTVPCCESCHDMKDRFTFAQWPSEWIERVRADFPKLSRETRIYLAKWIALVCDMRADGDMGHQDGRTV